MGTYLYGITIGPIISTLQYAANRGSEQKTRSLWAASAIFSYTMREIIRKLDEGEVTWFLPSPSEAQVSSSSVIPKTGLYPDRAIFLSAQSFDDIQSQIQEAKQQVASYVKANIDAVKIDLVCMEDEGDIGQIQRMQKMLDHQELSEEPRGSYKDHLVEELVGSREDKGSFGYQVAVPYTQAVAEYGKDEEQMQRKYAQHLAFLQSDGDRVGQLLSKLQNAENFQRFSGAMLQYAKAAAQVIEDYGGFCFYAGGDDLLAMLPVVSGEQHVFEIVERLDTLLKTHMATLKDIDQKIVESISLSVGLSLAHHRQPMSEMLVRVQDLLFGVAKQRDGKHAIALELQKHSGNSIATCMSLHSATYGIARDMFDNIIKMKLDDQHDLLSVWTKLMRTKSLLIIALDSEESEKMLRNYISQQFNEDIHGVYQDFFNNLIKLMLAVKLDTANANDAKTSDKSSEILEQVISILYMAKFFLETASNDND